MFQVKKLNDSYITLFEPAKHLWQVWDLILNMILPFYHFAGASPLPLDMGYLILVGSNILLSMVVQQQAVILEFLQGKMSTCPSTPPGGEAIYSQQK